MGYKTLDKLQNMLKKEQIPEELNKIMGAISDRYDVLSDATKDTNNVQLKEEIY